MYFEKREKIYIVAIVAVFIVAMALISYYFLFLQKTGSPGQNQGAPADDMTLFESAISQGNSGLCSRIKEEALRDQCMEAIAPSGGNAQPDEQALRDSGYFEEALSKGDASICENIVESELKLQCREALSSAAEDQPELTLDQKSDMDNFERAMSEGNPAYCASITEEELRRICSETVGA